MFRKIFLTLTLTMLLCGIAFAECPDVSQFKNWELVMMRPVQFNPSTGSSHFDVFLKNTEKDSYLNGSYIKSYWTDKTYWERFAIVGPDRTIMMWESKDEGETYTRFIDPETIQLFKNDMERWFTITIHEPESLQNL